MPNFLKVCQAKVHCEACRDPEQSAWRESVAQHYQMPDGWPKCPFGKPMKGDAPVEMKPLDPLDTNDPRNFTGGCGPCSQKKKKK